jgi:hypothetical protein
MGKELWKHSFLKSAEECEKEGLNFSSFLQKSEKSEKSEQRAQSSQGRLKRGREGKSDGVPPPPGVFCKSGKQRG